MRCFKIPLPRRSILLAIAVFYGICTCRTNAEPVSLVSAKDNTLFQYDPDDPNNEFNSNGGGNFFSAGRTYKRSQIRRGLIQFDFPDDIPAGATVVPGSVHLDLYVIDYPWQDEDPRPFWLVPLTGLGQPWGEGASRADMDVKGPGSGAAAEKDDATWFHTMYDPAIHDQETFIPDGPGFWPQKGALGDDPLDPYALYGDPICIVPSDIGPVTFSSESMEADINGWLQGGSSNFGWIVLGDESIGTDQASTNRGFASRENANPDLRPTLTFEYVPEPSCAVLLASAVLVLLCWRGRRSR